MRIKRFLKTYKSDRHPFFRFATMKNAAARMCSYNDKNSCTIQYKSEKRFCDEASKKRMCGARVCSMVFFFSFLSVYLISKNYTNDTIVNLGYLKRPRNGISLGLNLHFSLKLRERNHLDNFIHDHL